MDKRRVVLRPPVGQGALSLPAYSGVVVRFPVPDTEFGLVDALRAGHPQARRVLCDRHSGELLNVVARIFGPDFAGTPFVITTLQRSLECLDELSEPRAFRLWLLMRLVNAARWKLRLHAIRRWFRRQSHAAPTRRLPYSERLAATYALLDRLSVEQRLAFCLVIIQSMTLSEAAAILGTASGVLEKRLTRAHSRFTRLAQQYCPALLQTHRSHASLGVQIASEQDQLPGDSQLYEWDLARDRKPLCSA